ncbi:hypothetical protein GD627_13430 [Arthrobacter yangruifuii]|uniref:Uncharacterized protein n=1 Tax=Arthrobacter yangruifuii TaxID=2606616 RepID=A0A5N6MG36_9MICC|nr:hypothetical protein [Arthrobacter yangruifuii]KAD3515274.1 hypothetical protein GD627_13430 [Arthrobacter yangruifuii]
MKRPTNISQRLGGASAVLVLAGTVTLAGAPGAWAAGDYLQFSLDGKSYGPTISGRVFSESMTYIPGAGQTATVWVRNNSGDPARLSSAAVMGHSDPELIGYLGLTAWSGVSPAGRVELGATDSCMDLPEAWNLDSGEETALTFLVDMSFDAPNATQNRDAEFDLLFYLESTEAGLAPRAACEVLDGGTDNSGGGTGSGAGNGQPPSVGRVDGRDAEGVSQQASAPAAGSLVAVPGSGTTPGGLMAVPAGAISQNPAVWGPQGTESPDRETAPRILDARVQSTVEPVIRSLSGTLLIAMSVAFTAAVVLRVWSRRYV